MIRLHQYPPAFGLPSLSPFCVKVETYLRMTGAAYEIVEELSPLKGPRKKMPFIEREDEIISDSHWILERLEAVSAEPLDAWLAPAERASAFAFRRMLDEDLIRIILYSRWVDESGWRVLKREFRGYFPVGLRTGVVHWLRERQKKKARGMAILEFSPEEIYRLGAQHLEALAGCLGEKDFLFGARPSTADATAFAFLSTILKTPIDVPLRARALEMRRLTAYADRIERRYFSRKCLEEVHQ